MTNLQYILYSIAAALMKAGESLKDSADNVPAGIGFSAPDADGVITETGAAQTTNTGAAAPTHDSAGLPWDERIHSGGKTIKADGTWMKRKGATPPVVAAVEAELRAKMAQPGAAAPGVALGLPAPTGLPAPGPLGLPALGLPKPSKYAEFVAFLAANTGPGKAADEAWVNGSLAQLGTSHAALSTADDATVETIFAQFRSALTPAA